MYVCLRCRAVWFKGGDVDRKTEWLMGCPGCSPQLEDLLV